MLVMSIACIDWTGLLRGYADLKLLVAVCNHVTYDAAEERCSRKKRRGVLLLAGSLTAVLPQRSAP